MTDEAYTDHARGFGAKVKDLTAGAREVGRSALKEAMTWSAYQWTVLALLTAIFLLIALSYGGIRTELAALKQNEASNTAPDLAAIRGEMNAKLTDLQTNLTQGLTDVKTGLTESMTKLGAKIDAKAKATAPTPKPAPRPRPQ